VRNLATGESREHGYGKLVLATGASPNTPPFPVAESDRVRHFTRPADAMAFRQMAQTGQVGSAIVVGGGFIGCEVAEAAGSLWGIEVTLVEKEPQILPYVLDAEMAAMAERELARQDVRVVTGKGIEKIELDNDGNPVATIEGGETVTADYVFLCMGVHPEVALAEDAGLTIGETGAIAVNANQRTSDSDIYAGGDCAETVNQITGKPMYIPMGSLANRQGRVIAENLAGRSAEFPGAVGAFLVKVFDVNVGAVGLSESAARVQGLGVSAVWGCFPDKPDYYPESTTVSLKLIYETASRRLIGLQAVGKGDICRRIDVFSSLLHHKGTLASLLEFEQGYAPPYAEALDPLYHLGCMAEAQLAGTQFRSPSSAAEITDNSVQLIDVREAAEAEADPWPSPLAEQKIANIPLGELRDRTGELDSGRKTLILCKRGPRSFQAERILRAAGFAAVEILAGGLQSQQ